MASLIQGCVCVCVCRFCPQRISFLVLSLTWVQFNCSVVSDSATPWTTARQASLSITNSWSLPKLMSIESMMPSNHLVLCRPFLLLPSIFPSIMTTFKLKHHRSYTSNAVRWRQVNYASCSYHLRVLCYHHFFCRVASIHCKAKHADSSERNPLREIPHFSWLRSSGIPDIELWKQLIVWSGYPFMPYISQQSTNCSLIRHEEAFSLFPNLK